MRRVIRGPDNTRRGRRPCGLVVQALYVLQVVHAHVAAGGQPIWLEVDCGVKTDNIFEIVQAGADTCVAGSAVFGAKDAGGGYKTVMQALRRAAHPS